MGTENTRFRQGFKRGVLEIKGFGFKKYQRDFLEFLLRFKKQGFFVLWSILCFKGCLVVFFFFWYKGLFGWVFCPKGLSGKIFGLWESCHVLAL